MSDKLSEFALIAKFFAPLATDAAALSLTDDACLIKQHKNCDLVVTADALTAGVHFLADDPANLISSKALRVNLSDLAAKGAMPLGYLMTLALPHSCEIAWLECFARGLSEDQKRFGISLLGGDTTATPGPLSLSITALGQVPSGTMIRRGGAKPGDDVYVSGTIGDAGAGLAVLKGELHAGADTDFLVNRYHQPTPRLSLGAALRGVATAGLDVSDGLLGDLGHISEVSKVRIIVEADCIPRSDSVRRLWPGLEGITRAVTSGDDYEIAFTAGSTAAVREIGQNSDVPVTKIGRVEEGQGVVILDGSGREVQITHSGFVHF